MSWKKAKMEQWKRSAGKSGETLLQKIVTNEKESVMSDFKHELLGRFNIFRKKESVKTSKTALLKQQEALLQEIENQKDLIGQLEDQFEAFKTEMTKECQRCFEKGFEQGRSYAKIEEEGLLEELEMLKEMCATLKQGNLT